MGQHLQYLIPRFEYLSGQPCHRLGQRQAQLSIARLLKETDITRRVSVHSLRHTFATRLYRKTGDLYLIQRALGHRQITTTEIYARVGDDSVQRAIARL